MDATKNYPIHLIGPKIRELRKEKGMKLTDFAEATGMSNALLSKIENGRMIPTLPKLLDIMQYLAISPEDFFMEIKYDSHPDAHRLIPKETYTPYVKEESAKGFDYRSILDKSLQDRSFQVSHVSLEPGNQRPKVRTDAFEFIYVLKGKIDYIIGEDTVLIHEGDSFFFDGMVPHVPLNKTTAMVEYLVIYFFTDRMDDHS